MSTDKIILTDLREVLQKEIKAKDFYGSNFEQFSDQRFKEAISHIFAEEKKHEKKVKELIEYIKRLG